VSGNLGSAIGQVDHLPLPSPFDGGMRLVDEAPKPFREPVVPTRLSKITVHSLLNDDPLAVVGHDDPVEVEVKAVLNRRAVNFGH